jgi:hypothetical protein
MGGDQSTANAGGMVWCAGWSAGVGEGTQQEEGLRLELGPARTSGFLACLVDGLVPCTFVDH